MEEQEEGDEHLNLLLGKGNNGGSVRDSGGMCVARRCPSQPSSLSSSSSSSNFLSSQHVYLISVSFRRICRLFLLTLSSGGEERGMFSLIQPPHTLIHVSPNVLVSRPLSLSLSLSLFHHPYIRQYVWYFWFTSGTCEQMR